MLTKPVGCQDCPMYGDGRGFVPDEILSGVPVTVCGSLVTAEDEQAGRPFMSKLGLITERQYMVKGGLVRGANVSLMNAIRCRWINPATGQRTDDLPPAKILNPALEWCAQYDVKEVTDGLSLVESAGTVGADNTSSMEPDHNSTPVRTLVVAQGALAWKKFKGPGRLNDWRGFLAPDTGGPRVLGTLHPLDLFHNPRMIMPTKLDWLKVRRFMAGTWPQPLPDIIDVQDDLDGFAAWIAGDFSFVVIDTEYTMPERQLTVLGLYSPGGPVWHFNYQDMTPGIRAWFGQAVRVLVSRRGVVFQNGFADIPVLEKHFGIAVSEYTRVDDTLLSHALLWSEFPHDLEFLDSLYGTTEKLKHLATDDLRLYNAGDVVATANVWGSVRKELEADPAISHLYETNMLPLVSIILDMQKRGIRLNHARLAQAETLYKAKVEAARRIVTAYCGFPLNLNGPQLLTYLTLVDKLKLKSTKKDAIAEAREKFLLVDHEEELNYETVLRRINQGAHPLLEARALHGNARQCLSNYVEAMRGPDGEFAERVYPEFKPWAQANARWSTTNPPLAQLPADLRDILMPDPGWPWFGWDFDQQELRILAATAEDRPLLEAFEKEYDVHTMAACDIFDIPYPPALVSPFKSDLNRDWILRYDWQAGKDDLRRVFAKRFQYRLIYGGDPKGAGSIPGVKTLGLNGKKLVEASKRWLAAHPAVPKFWDTLTKNAVSKGVVRDAYMGRRMLLSDDAKGRTREAFDFPMQATASRMHNYTIIKITKEFGGLARFVYSMHDSFMFAVHEASWETVTEGIRAFVNRPWRLANGQEVYIPGSFKEVKL